MTSPGSSGRTRTAVRTYNAEDQALNQIAREAEKRLAVRREERARAREMRQKELEREQRQAEDKQDHHFKLLGGVSRRIQNDDDLSDDSKDLKRELAVLDEKYKKVMMTNAQLDNEKQTYRYQLDLLHDQMEDVQEELIETSRLQRDTTRELEAKKRELKHVNQENTFLKEQLAQRDKLIEEYGLVFLSSEELACDTESGDGPALITKESANVLERLEGTVDEKIKSLSETRNKLQEENKKLKQRLEEEMERIAIAEKYSSPKQSAKVNGPDMELLEIQMDLQRQISEYKFKLKKAEQDITQYEGNILRLESQVKRFKTSAENSEKNEEELKSEKRKLQRELREAQTKADDLQNQNSHLTKRLEKMKSARNAILKP